jgi:hypothetical protein
MQVVPIKLVMNKLYSRTGNKFYRPGYNCKKKYCNLQQYGKQSIKRIENGQQNSENFIIYCIEAINDGLYNKICQSNRKRN